MFISPFQNRNHYSSLYALSQLLIRKLKRKKEDLLTITPTAAVAVETYVDGSLGLSLGAVGTTG